MAPQDYVKRNRAPQKRTANKKKTMPEAPAKFSVKQKVIMVVAFIVVSGFGYGLWYLKQQPVVETQPTIFK